MGTVGKPIALDQIVSRAASAIQKIGRPGIGLGVGTADSNERATGDSIPFDSIFHVDPRPSGTRSLHVTVRDNVVRGAMRCIITLHVDPVPLNILNPQPVEHNVMPVPEIDSIRYTCNDSSLPLIGGIRDGVA